MAIKALTFDTGGTILDWHRGISGAFAAAGAARGLKADWAAVTNEYRRRSLKGIVNAEHPAYNFDDVHRAKLDEVIAEFKLDALTTADRDAHLAHLACARCVARFRHRGRAAAQALRGRLLHAAHHLARGGCVEEERHRLGRHHFLRDDRHLQDAPRGLPPPPPSGCSSIPPRS